MTTIGQIAQSYTYMLAQARAANQTPQQYLESLQGDLNRLTTALDQGQLSERGGQVLGRIRTATGLGYGTPTVNRPADWREDVPNATARTAIEDFRLLQTAAQRPPFNGNVEMYMQAVIASAANPAVASQPFTLDNLNGARVFSGAAPAAPAAPPPAAPAAPPAAGGSSSAPPPAAPPAPAAAGFTPALNTALTNFLTGDATATEITALKGAVNVADSTPPGRLDGRGGENGAATMVATRTALGGPLSATNHPELYALATARYTALTGLPADRAATPAEIDAAEARVRAMTPAQRAEYQSVTYLLGANETTLPNGKINIDGIYGPRTEASVAQGNTAAHPAAAAPEAGPAAAGPAAPAAPAPTREVILDLSGESSRGDRERLINRAPAVLEAELNKNGGNFRVVVFNPAADRNGPQTIADFVATRPPGTVVGVMGIREDGIRGNREFEVRSVPQAIGSSSLPSVNLTVTDDALRGDQREQFPAAIESAVGSLRSQFAPAAAGVTPPPVAPAAAAAAAPPPRVDASAGLAV